MCNKSHVIIVETIEVGDDDRSIDRHPHGLKLIIIILLATMLQLTSNILESIPRSMHVLRIHEELVKCNNPSD